MHPVIPAALRLPEPCPANWDEMQGGDEVRHCAHCATDVHYLSAMTRSQAAALLADRRQAGLCVRYAVASDGVRFATRRVAATAPRAQLDGASRLLATAALVAGSLFLAVDASATDAEEAFTTQEDPWLHVAGGMPVPDEFLSTEPPPTEGSGSGGVDDGSGSQFLQGEPGEEESFNLGDQELRTAACLRDHGIELDDTEIVDEVEAGVPTPLPVVAGRLPLLKP
ncbi:MAG: hypothetical protein H6700_10375 [Myxococcales bacterium]|nr:hypothetical protein [Myxococcales bacterium]